MGRTISEIYSQAKQTRDQYLQITDLDTNNLSGSKMSVMNVITYVMAVLIYTFENTLDLFQSHMVDTLSNKVNGTPVYYVNMAKKYQPKGVLKVSDDGTNFGYEDPDGQTLIKHASFEPYTNGRGIILKVAKGDTPTPLSDNEYVAFKNYIDQIKFVGARITIRSIPGDIIIPKMRVIYDDTSVSLDTAISNIQNAITNYANNLNYDGIIHESAIIDVVQNAVGIEDVPSTMHEIKDGIRTKKLIPSTIYVKQFNYLTGSYNNKPIELSSWIRPESGYILVEDQINGIKINTFNSENIEFQSKTDYYKENRNEEIE